jgi:uncharacterized protein (DUF433 family)
MEISRITQDPNVMGARPCIRGLRVTVGTVLGLLAAGHREDQILEAYPYRERDDIRASVAYAAWRTQEVEVPTQDLMPAAVGCTVLSLLSEHRNSLLEGAILTVDARGARVRILPLKSSPA